jgi:hypothetical protein
MVTLNVLLEPLPGSRAENPGPPNPDPPEPPELPVYVTLADIVSSGLMVSEAIMYIGPG